MRKTREKQRPLSPQWPDHQLAQELKLISRILDDNPQTLELIVQDLSDRVDSGVGAPGLTAEQVLRCAVIKQLHQFSYRKLEFHLVDSQSCQRFCRLPYGASISKATLAENLGKIEPGTWKAINDHLVLWAQWKKARPEETPKGPETKSFTSDETLQVRGKDTSRVDQTGLEIEEPGRKAEPSGPQHRTVVNSFRKENKVYTIDYSGQRLEPIPVSLPLRHIAYLVANKGTLYQTPLELETGIAGKPIPEVGGGVLQAYSEMTETELQTEGLSLPSGSAVSFDRSKLRGYNEQLDDIAKQLDQAKDNADEAQIHRWEEIKGQLIEQMREAGLMIKEGRLRPLPRQWDPDNEAARKRVSKNIHRGISTIREHNEDLANHLDASLTPVSFPYCYDPKPSVVWHLT